MSEHTDSGSLQMGAGISDEVCPYVGRYDDPDNYHFFPTAGNYCHLEGGPFSIEPSHQAGFCLGASWPQCARYKAALKPAEAQHTRKAVPPPVMARNLPSVEAMASLLVVAVFLVVGLLVLLRPSDLSSDTSDYSSGPAEAQDVTLPAGAPTVDSPSSPGATAVPTLQSSLVSAPPDPTLAPVGSVTAMVIASDTSVAVSTPSATSADVPTMPPTTTPTFTPGPTMTAVPSATPTRTPTRAFTPFPTRTPTSTPRQVPLPSPSPTPGSTTIAPSPTPRPAATGTPLPSPTLLSPSDAWAFSEQDEILLQWQPVGSLPPDAYYVITVAYSHEGATWHDETPWLRVTSWNLGEHRYLLDLSDDGRFYWSIQVMRQTGVDADDKPTGVALSPPSAVRMFTWTRASDGKPGSRRTPTAPPP